MKNAIYFFLIFISCPFYFTYSQIKFEWASNLLDCSVGKIVSDNSGNIYLAGSKMGPVGRIDMLFIKFTQTGSINWIQTYADTISPFPSNQNGAGNILFDNSSNIFLGGSRLWKYTNKGQLLWNVYPGLYRGFAKMGFDVDYNFLTSSQNYNSGYLIRKFSYNGDSIWSRIFKPSGTIDARWSGAVDDSKDNIITAGYMNKNGIGDLYDYVTVKYSNAGDLVWANRYESGVDNINSGIAIDDSDNVYVTGGSEINNLNYNIVTLKYAPDGRTIWTKSFDGGAFDYGTDIEVDGEGNVYISGAAVGYGAVLLKYDVNGNFQWIRNHSNISFSANYPLLELDKAGDPYLLFSINTTMGRYEYGIAKYNKSGTQKWLARYNYNNHFCEISDAEIDDDFNLLVTGHCGDYMTTVKWSQIITNVSTVSNQVPNEFKLYQNYPNPFNPATNIQFDIPNENFVTVKLYDLLGKEVTTLINEFKQAGTYVISFNGNNLSSGIYYYRIESGTFNQVKKMMLIK